MRATTPRTAFFAEDNLNLLLNVVADTLHSSSENLAFDKTSSRDRTQLFEAMTTVYRAQLGTQPSPSLSTLNKRALKAVYKTLTHADVPRADVSSNAPSTSSTIRDLDASQLPHTLPTAFPKFDAPVDTVTQQQTDAAMQRLQDARDAERLPPKPQPSLQTETVDGDNSDVMTKLKALEDARDTLPPPAEEEDATRPETTLSDAMTAFDASSDVLNAQVAQATKQHNAQQHALDDAFRQAQHPPSTTPKRRKRKPATGKGVDATEVADALGSPAHVEKTYAVTKENETADVLAASFAPLVPHGESLSTRLTDDIARATDVEVTDRCAFEQGLQLSREQDALDERMLLQSHDVRERLLIAPRRKYVTRTHFLEVSSNDRLRTLQTTETPSSFTVYFGSDEEGVRVLPIYDNHFFEDPEDTVTCPTDDGCTRTFNLDTTAIRDRLGYLGYPNANGFYPMTNADISDDHIVDYKTLYNCANATRANVDTVFHNVIALQTNYVQLYFPEGKLPQVPYLLLEICQFANVYNATNNLVRKSFCKLFYDRSSNPSASQSQYHVFVPLNRERKTFTTPLASIDSLTFNVYNPCTQKLLTPAVDSRSVSCDLVRISEITVDTTSSYLCLKLVQAVKMECFSKNDCIRFDPCLHWYDSAEYTNWHSEKGIHEQNEQTAAEQWYCDQLAQNVGASKECLDNLKKEYIRKQVKFSYPTHGYPQNDTLVELSAYLTRPEGHAVLDTVAAAETITEICIDVGGFAGISIKHTLLTGIIYSISNSTNISMTVYTRDEDDVVMSTNI